MYAWWFIVLLCLRSVHGFYLQEESEDPISEPESCDAACQNGGQCFLSSFCICPKGFSGRYCEVSLHEQCGPFTSMTTMEIDCVLCICYNGLFSCDLQPAGLCRDGRLFHRFLTRAARIAQTLKIIQKRFPSIHGFEPMSMSNVSVDDKRIVHLKGYRLVLNQSIRQSISSLLVLFSLCFVYLFH